MMGRFLTGAAPVVAIVVFALFASSYWYVGIAVLVIAGAGAGAYNWRRANRKRCPECAEPVRAAASRCRYCGHRFSLAD